MENLYYILSSYAAICFVLGSGLWLFLRKKSSRIELDAGLKPYNQRRTQRFTPQLRREMHQLRQQGKDPEEIAQSLHRPTADIEFALQLDMLISQKKQLT